MRAVLGLLLLLMGFTSPVLASQDTVKWSKVNIPLQGKPGGWVLASGSDIQYLSQASNGNLYAYGKGLSYTLYQSTDGGSSWSAIGNVTDNIVDIAIAPDNTVYYATPSQVYKSVDGTNKFAPLPTPPRVGISNIEITAIDATRLSNNIIIVSTRDADSPEFGGIYLMDDAPPFAWRDTSLGAYDAYTVAFSINYPADHQIIAVVSDETDTFITTNFGNGWGSTIANAKIAGLVPVSASIAFPKDYNPSLFASYFVAIDSGAANRGDVYRVETSIATDLNIGATYGLGSVDVSGLAVSGDRARVNLMAGAADSAEVYISTDTGRNWQRSNKPPTGQSKTYVLMAPAKAYAATSGNESALSYTTDGGITWNQLSLIDTVISSIVDLAPSPSSQGNTLFMLTNKTGGKDSLWRSLNDGKNWERVLSSALADIDAIDRVRLPPQYGSESQTVFVAGISNSKDAIWKSTDNGQTLARRTVPSPINTWAVVDNTTLFIGSYDGVRGLVYLSTNSGVTYSEGAMAGSQSLNSITPSPNYAKDKTILVGNSDGWIFYSEDGGASFVPLPADAKTKPLSGNISIAFDSKYASNNTVYAASSTAGKGIYRFIIGKSDKWEKIDSPTTAALGQMAVSTKGILYATNLTANGGMERSLDPTYPLGPTFESVTNGLDDAATLFGLWLGDVQLWAIDSTNTSLLTYIDSLTQPIVPASPRDKTIAVGTLINYEIKNVSLDWKPLPGATNYKWQLDYDTEFSNVPAGFEGTTQASSVRLPTLDPATSYYWRVRATQPVLSPWSDKWSFTTSFGTETNAPELKSPIVGANGVPVKPIFQWSAIAGASGYELVVSTEAAVNNPTILKSGSYALANTAWQSNIALNYNTTYYWKVRAVSADTYSPWSAVSAFTTEPTPATPTTPAPSTPPTTQSPLPSISNWTEWLVPLGGIMFLVFLLIMLTMLITMIILVAKVIKL